MKKICVLSGKGGVGKSSIAASLAVLLSETRKVVCADCDVDASNLALVLGAMEKDFREWKKISTNQRAEINEKKCNSCRECVSKCYFGAIEWDEKKKKPLVNPLLCEGCGTCVIACPQKAIRLKKVNNAKAGFAKTAYGFNVFSAQLEMGESGSGKVVSFVKRMAGENSKDAEIMVIDSAAGIGCPVIASITGTDFVIAVTEPSPSAFSDLKRALGVVEHFGIPCGIVINKCDLNTENTLRIEKFAKSKNAKILSKIPYEKGFVEALIELRPVIELKPRTKEYFDEIASGLIKAGLAGKAFK